MCSTDQGAEITFALSSEAWFLRFFFFFLNNSVPSGAGYVDVTWCKRLSYQLAIGPL